MRARSPVPLLLLLALATAACGGDGDPGGATAAGSSGPTTQAEADEAMGGLCDIASGTLTEMSDVHEAFHGRAHEALHSVAAEAQQADPVVAASLLEAKAVVEADLEESAPPEDLPAHAETLVTAFAAALEAVGLQAATCPSA